jgi:hypothetical protein
MQISSSELITLTNELGASGRFIELARNGQLVAVSEAIWDRVRITKEIADVEGKLRSCNDPARLAAFAIWCSRRKVDFSSRLRDLVAKLEARKSQLLTNLHEVDQRLSQENSSLEWEVDPAPSTSLIPQRLRKKSDPSLVKRNAIIDANPNLPTEEICKTLDDSARGDEIIEWLPIGWVRNYQVETFLQAYRDPQCRDLVHKMISVRRHRIPVGRRI